MKLLQPCDAIHRHTSKRGYDTPGGVFPGVTSILSATKTDDAKLLLQRWREDNKHKPGLLEAAQNRGTWAHAMAENWLRRRARLPLLPDLPAGAQLVSGGFGRSLIRWLEEHCHGPLGIELPLWHPDGYAGTCDGVLWTFDSIEPLLVDFKSNGNQRVRSAEIVHDYGVQLAAYRRGIRFLYGLDIRRGAIVVARRAGRPEEHWFDSRQLDAFEAEWCERLRRFQQEYGGAHLQLA